MAIEIAVDKRPQVQVVSLRGRLDSAGAPELQTSMDSVLEEGSKNVLIECSELKYVSSVGLGIFVASGKSLGAAGGSLSFAGVTPHVRSVFDMVGFTKLFELFPTLEEALQSPRLSGPDA